MREYFWPGAFLLGGALLGLPLSLMSLDRGAPFLYAVVGGAFNGFFGIYLFTLFALDLSDRRRSTDRKRRGFIRGLFWITVALVGLAVVVPRLGGG